MKINETTLNCCKPKRFTTFTGADSSNGQEKKLRAKHFYQLNDEALKLRSVIKAHKEVQQGGKMRMLKAMPALTTVTVGTIFAITQPGKLAAKAGAGLGFLVLNEAVGNYCNHEAQKGEQKEPTLKNFLVDVAKIGLGIGVLALAAKGFKTTKAGKFVQKEIKQLTKEINATKLGKFVDDKLNPFIKKHNGKFNALGILGPIASVIGSAFAQVSLMNGVSKDIQEKAQSNYLKDKMIIAQAKEHFDSVEAPVME